MNNKLSFSERMSAYRHHPMSLVQRILVLLAAFVTFGVLVALIVYILVMGVPNLRPSLFAWKYNSENVSMLPAIVNTVVMIVMTLVMSVPFGVGAAIYLVEYAKRGNKLVKLIRITAETLSGIPSIVYGLFGFLMFVIALHMSYSMLAGALTLAIMVLPTILRTTEELWTRRRAFAYGISCCVAVGSSRYFFRCYSCHRTYCRRDCGVNFYVGYRYGCRGKFVGLRPNTGYPYVLLVKRRTL